MAFHKAEDNLKKVLKWNTDCTYCCPFYIYAYKKTMRVIKGWGQEWGGVVVGVEGYDSGWGGVDVWVEG